MSESLNQKEPSAPVVQVTPTLELQLLRARLDDAESMIHALVQRVEAVENKAAPHIEAEIAPAVEAASAETVSEYDRVKAIVEKEFSALPPVSWPPKL